MRLSREATYKADLVAQTQIGDDSVELFDLTPL
eukprot:COSAG02_NODE_2547_length_8563_cov_9.105388_3_plen_33_part_00